MVTMMRFICLSRCTSEVRLFKPKVTTQPRVLWLDHRLAHSAALRRKRPSVGVKAPDPRCLSPSLWSARTDTSVLNTLRVYPARPFTHTPVAFASSSAASAPTSDESIKTREVQTPTTVPVEDAKRILRLAHPERWRLGGKPECCLRGTLCQAIYKPAYYVIWSSFPPVLTLKYFIMQVLT